MNSHEPPCSWHEFWNAAGNAETTWRTIAESFYVLTGAVRIYDGRDWLDAVPGDFVHVPPGGIHAFRNESGEPATVLIHFAPGAPREGYFEGLALPVDAPEPDAEALARFYAEHDNTWV